jgi:molecular chaperone GrpE (heat shock protein)
VNDTAALPDAWAITEPPRPVPEPLRDGAGLRERLERAGTTDGKLIGQLQDRIGEAHAELREFLLGLLDVADAIERVAAAIAASGGSDERAVRATGRRLQQVLRKQGVTRAELVGRVLDPALADADEAEPDGAVPNETVLRERQGAYLWCDEVLRRGRVVVSTRLEP